MDGQNKKEYHYVNLDRTGQNDNVKITFSKNDHFCYHNFGEFLKIFSESLN